MKNLRALQEDFKAYLLGKSSDIEAHVQGENSDFVQARLGVYGEAYALRLLELLGNDFPRLKKWMGKKAFEKTGLAYLEAHPSQFFSVRYLGQHFARFLKNEAHAEMAAFEWALNDTMDAADASLLTAEDLAAVPQEKWADLRIALHPSVRLLALCYNIPALWQALEDKKKLPRAVRGEAVTWVVWRRGVQSYYCHATPEEACVIRALLAEKTFGEVCQALCAWLPEEAVASHAVNILARWLQEERLCK